MSDIDPAIQALLDEAAVTAVADNDDADEAFAGTDADTPPGREHTIHDVDLNIHEFAPIEERLSATPLDIFDDKSYYKTALSNENQSAQRVHQVLTKYLTCADPKDRGVFRQQIVTAYWELLRGMAPKMANPNVAMPKRMLIRFGVILPSLFKPETKEFFSRIVFENRLHEPVLYADEWFAEIASGRMNVSATDEARPAHTKDMSPEGANSAEQARLMQLQSKNSGKMQVVENQLQLKENERSVLEEELRRRVDLLFEHQPIYALPPHKESYTESQKRLFGEISERLRALSKNDKELAKCLKEYEEVKTAYDGVERKLADGPAIVQVDSGKINTEFDTVRQMAKMTVGRQGNQFPIFTREFFHCTENGTGTRENVVELLRWIESIDPGAFCRIHKNIPNRIVPYVLLVPTYGDRGFCWEPFDRYNRITSRGRIVVPMYPRDLRIAILTAVADLRWQVAKEKASFYWMEEGLTGQYYQYIDRAKLKGDIKQFFIEDYILWMTKESSGVQRLDKEVRGIFWRNMPYPRSLKEDLRKRSLVYDELCVKDNNRAMSDGY
ncbi:MAG: hypothetical protein IJ191_09530 [Treponema sp.]|nr:hypothetical protein [Treponema sp.]